MESGEDSDNTNTLTNSVHFNESTTEEVIYKLVDDLRYMHII